MVKRRESDYDFRRADTYTTIIATVRLDSGAYFKVPLSRARLGKILDKFIDTRPDRIEKLIRDSGIALGDIIHNARLAGKAVDFNYSNLVKITIKA